jgi:NTE family protein
MDGIHDTGRLRQNRAPAELAFTSMQAMQDTISQLRLSAYAPDVRIEIPRNASGFFEFWCAEELIELGRERAAQAFEHIER